MPTDARGVALKALGAFRRGGAWSNAALDSLIKKERLSVRDAALAQRICLGVLQNKLLLDHYIAAFSSIKPAKMDPVVLDILELTAYQLIFLDRIPASAAVDEGVALAKAKCNPRAAGFVNAVSRSLSRATDSLPEPPDADKTAYLSIKYSHPLLLVRALAEAVGETELPALLAADNGIPPVSLQVNTLKTNTDAALAALLEEGAEAVRHPWLDGCILLSGGAPQRLRAFSEGLVTVQDVSARLAAEAAAPKPGDRVLDACSAPGGKAFACAMLMKNEGYILATDLHEKKLPLIERGAERLGINIIETAAADAGRPYPALTGKFDVVIADVPCSGFGVIRKKPEIRYKSLDEAAGLPDVQLRILRNAAACVRPGGTLLYSTCTLLPRENEGVVSRFLSETPELHAEGFTLPEPIGESASGLLTLYPHIHGTDGFFICKMRKRL